MAIKSGERDSCSPGWRAPEPTRVSRLCLFWKSESFPELFLAWAESERALLVSRTLVRAGRMAGISVAVRLDYSSSRLLGTLHRDVCSAAEGCCAACPTCHNSSLPQLFSSKSKRSFARKSLAGLGGVSVAWTLQKGQCEQSSLWWVCAAGISPSQRSLIDLGQPRVSNSP